MSSFSKYLPLGLYVVALYLEIPVLITPLESHRYFCLSQDNLPARMLLKSPKNRMASTIRLFSKMKSKSLSLTQAINKAEEMKLSFPWTPKFFGQL